MNTTVQESPHVHAGRRSNPFESAICATRSRANGNLAPQIAQFETIMVFFKEGVQLPFLASGKPSQDHRAILSGILGFGEALFLEVNRLPKAQKEQLDLVCDSSFLPSAVRYLRDTYLMVYGSIDEQQAAEDFEKILSCTPQS